MALRGTNFQPQHQLSHGDVKYNIGSTADSTVIMFMVTDGDYTCGEH